MSDRARRAGRLLAACAALALAALALAESYADDLRKAIELVARHPAFAAGLAAEPGWTATGYDAQDRYGLWRVDLAAADGRPLGWAQVQLEAGSVLSWEASFELEGAAYEAAKARLLGFLRADPGFRALAGDVDEHDWVWVGYEAWRDTWIVQLERGPDSLAVVLRSAHAWTRSLDDLRIVQVNATGVVAVEEWRSRRGAAAIAQAFSDPRVAAAVRGVEGWTAEAEPLDRRRWLVRFVADGRLLFEAAVDLGGPASPAAR